MAAFTAGRRPKRMPMAMEKSTATRIAGTLMAEGVPMTKCEVRSVCLSKLALTRDAVCWDIGAGTGSVAVEMGLQAREGHVYAV